MPPKNELIQEYKSSIARLENTIEMQRIELVRVKDAIKRCEEDHLKQVDVWRRRLNEETKVTQTLQNTIVMIAAGREHNRNF